MDALKEKVKQQAEEISSLREELKARLSRTSSGSSSADSQLAESLAMDKIALEKLNLRLSSIAEVERLKIVQESQLVTSTFEKSLELLRKDLHDSEENLQIMYAKLEEEVKGRLDKEVKMKEIGDQVRIFKGIFEECERNITMVKKEIEGLLELNSSKCQEEEIMKVNLKVLEDLEVKKNFFFTEMEKLQVEMVVLESEKDTFVSKQKEIEKEVEEVDTAMKEVDHAVHCLQLALQWADFTQNLEPLAQMVVFNPLVKEAIKCVERSQESSIFNLEIFVELCEAEERNTVLTEEEKQKQKEEFLESKKSTMAALPFIQEGMEQICEEKSQLESKLTEKTHEAERWDMALSVVKQKIEEKKSKICEAKFEICYLEKKISKKNMISWILEFFGFFGKDEFYRENLEKMIEKKLIYEADLANLKENEELLLKEKKEFLEEVSKLERSIDAAEKNFDQKMELLNRVNLGLQWAEIWESAIPLSHLAAKFSYLEELTIKMVQSQSQLLQLSSSSHQDGVQ